jgi:hypothetical protein
LGKNTVVNTINLNLVVSCLMAAFGLYAAVRVYRHATKKAGSNLLPPLGWLSAGLLSSLHGFVAESGTMILVFIGVYWLTNIDGRNSRS